MRSYAKHGQVISIMAFHRFDKFYVFAHVVGRSAIPGEIVCTEVDNHEIRAILLEIIGHGIVVVEQQWITLAHGAHGLSGIVARDTHARMSHYHVVGIEIACQGTSVSLVAVLGLQLEVAVLSALRAIAASIAVAYHLYQTAFPRHRLKRAFAACREREDGGTAILALCHLLQTQAVSAFSKVLGEHNVVRLLAREAQLSHELAVYEHLMVALTLFTNSCRDGRACKIGLHIGANPVVAHGAIVHALHTSRKTDVRVIGLHRAISKGNTRGHEKRECQRY